MSAQTTMDENQKSHFSVSSTFHAKLIVTFN